MQPERHTERLAARREPAPARDRRRSPAAPAVSREPDDAPCHDAAPADRGRQRGGDPPRRRPLRPAHHAAGQADPDQMSAQPRHPGAAPVGRLAELPPLERRGDPLPAALVRRAGRAGGVCRTSWRRGTATARPRARRRLRRPGQRPWPAHSRRPLMGHAPGCPCAGADECVFARFVALAAEGAREDAVLMAALMVRADLALGLALQAERIGLRLMRGQTPADRAVAEAQGRRRSGRPARRPPRRSARSPAASGSLATAMWWALACSSVSASRMIPTCPFQNTRSPRRERRVRRRARPRAAPPACRNRAAPSRPAAEQRQLHQRRAVEAAGAAPAPEVGDAEEALGLRHQVAPTGARCGRGTCPPPRSRAKPPVVPVTAHLGEEGQLGQHPRRGPTGSA